MTRSNTRSKKRINRRKTKRMNHGGNPVDNYYEILGVEPNATTKDIKKAYTFLALKHHPDRHINEKNEEIKEFHANKFTEISNAYTVLSDTDNRKEYNKTINPVIIPNEKDSNKTINPVIIPNEKDSNKTINPVANENNQVNQQNCPSNAKIVDAFFNDLHQSYFASGKDNTGDDDYIITRTHNTKVTAYPSAFSTINDPIHLYTKLTDDVKYDNWWEQYIMDSWAIDDMFELVNLQNYNHEYNCKKESNGTKDESEQCKKHKKYKALINTKDNVIHKTKNTENINVGKILKT